MSSFAYERNQSAAVLLTEGDVQATQGFEAHLPMESNVEDEFISFPWEATPDFVPSVSTGVFPPIAGSFVTVLHSRVQEVAQEYVARTESQLPDAVRESFVRGVGMFDFDSPDEGIDDLLG